MLLLKIFLLISGHWFVSTFIEELKLLNQLFSHISCKLSLVFFSLSICQSLLLLLQFLLLLFLLIKLYHCFIFHGRSNIVIWFGNTVLFGQSWMSILRNYLASLFGLLRRCKIKLFDNSRLEYILFLLKLLLELFLKFFEIWHLFHILFVLFGQIF